MCKERFNTIQNIAHRVSYTNSAKKQQVLYVNNKNQSVLLYDDDFHTFIENAQRLVEEEYAILLRSL